jgi:hypothetical protein
MDPSKGVNAYSSVSFHVGGNSGNESGGAGGFLPIELALVVGVFSLLDRLENLVNGS